MTDTVICNAASGVTRDEIPLDIDMLRFYLVMLNIDGDSYHKTTWIHTLKNKTIIELDAPNDTT